MIIGLTGGIASGKTLCSDWLAARSIAVIDADIIAREVVANGSPLLQELADVFGRDILTADGDLNRGVLRVRAFIDDAARNRLNAIMQPAIRHRLLQQLQAAPPEPYRLLSAPLLLENGLDVLCDLILVVDVSAATQLSRGCQRDRQRRDAITAIIAAQISREERLRRANFIVNNESGIPATYRQLAALHQRFLGWAQQHDF